MEYRRLKAQGVVFNSRRFAFIDDFIGLIEYAAIDPYSGQSNNLIKYTNKLENHPPMHGLFTPAKTVVYFNSADFLDDLYVRKNQYYTKD